MTLALSLYSTVFMRYALAVTPKNYLLFGCHLINTSSQLVQGYRYMQYWNFGGREAVEKAKEAEGGIKAALEKTADKAKEVVGK
jgi:hypothetical protein